MNRFLYVERNVVSRDGNALTVTDKRGVAHVAVAQLAVLRVALGKGPQRAFLFPGEAPRTRKCLDRRCTPTKLHALASDETGAHTMRNRSDQSASFSTARRLNLCHKLTDNWKRNRIKRTDYGITSSETGLHLS